jgi:methionyl-tRNA formyltransferase
MTDTRLPRLVFAGNRPIAVDCLRAFIEADWRPAALLVAAGKHEQCAADLVALARGAEVFRGAEFRSPEGLERLRAIAPDYILSVHFPYILPTEVLAIPTIGSLNLHPAFLPFNRGWHTPSWAILEGTPYGGTLHWIDSGVDTGDVAVQRRIDPRASDTADGLYRRVLALETDLMREAIPLMKARRLPRVPQVGAGTSHTRSELEVQRRLDLQEMSAVELLRRLRALTTNRWEEAGFFEQDGQRVRVRVELRDDDCDVD